MASLVQSNRAATVTKIATFNSRVEQKKELRRPTEQSGSTSVENRNLRLRWARGRRHLSADWIKPHEGTGVQVFCFILVIFFETFVGVRHWL